jgi:hypothetical protein
VDQKTLVDTLKSHIDEMQGIFSWALLVAVGIGWAGLTRQKQIEASGIKIYRRYAFYVACSLYILTNIVLLLLFLRLGEILLLLNNSTFVEGFTVLSSHKWILNPYAYFGNSTISKLLSSIGTGLLVLFWWILNT